MDSGCFSLNSEKPFFSDFPFGYAKSMFLAI